MHKLTVLSALSTCVLSTFFVIACDDTKNNVAAPTTFDVAGVSAAVTAGAAIVDSNAGTPCAAFTIPLSVTIEAGATAVAVTNVSAQFLGSTGISMPQVTLPAPVPTVQFGSALVEAKSARTIPFMLPIGCVRDHTGTVVVLVSTRDGHGHSTTTTVSTPVGPPGDGTPGSASGSVPPNVPR